VSTGRLPAPVGLQRHRKRRWPRPPRNLMRESDALVARVSGRTGASATTGPLYLSRPRRCMSPMPRSAVGAAAIVSLLAFTAPANAWQTSGQGGVLTVLADAGEANRVDVDVAPDGRISISDGAGAPRTLGPGCADLTKRASLLVTARRSHGS
jgi:hypothetical protein